MADMPLIVDGHVHITNRVYWEGLDPWQPQPFGFDYAQAKASGVNVIIENVGPYGYANFNYTPKQTLRLIEAFHRTVERHHDKMGLALTASDARRLVASGRVAVFLGIEAGFDHEGDPDVLRALYRLGLRVVQFSTQTCFNSFADAELGGSPVWHGINDRGRDLVALMNELGILIDITHATPQAQAQLIAASQAPIVASHSALEAVSGHSTVNTGMISDSILEALAGKGGLIGIIGAATAISRRYREWMAANPEKAADLVSALFNLIGFTSSMTRAALDHGEFGAWLDDSMRARHLAVFAAAPTYDPEAATLAPTADEWAAHAAHVIQTVGPDHVGIGLDMVGGRACIPRTASGYPELIAALRRVTTEENVRKVAGENWLRVLEQTTGT
jgi:membrane dipeptidase